MLFAIALLVGGLLAGAIASVAGFGIGSILTPIFAIHHPLKIAVAIVSIPHVIGTAVRFVRLRQHLDRHVYLNFGLSSSVGGLLGALVSSRASSPALAVVFGCLLLFAGLSGLVGLSSRMRFGRRAAWIAGAISGFFGGLVGNQGGIRSAGLLSFDINKEALVATATATALIVDGARMPVYFVTQMPSILAAWPLILVATTGVVIGTVSGVPLLRRIPEPVFRTVVSVLITLLGIYMIVRR